MKEIDIEKTVREHYPDFLGKYPSFVQGAFFTMLNKILYVEKINDFLKKNSHQKNFAFIDEVFSLIDCSFSFSYKDLARIPVEGRIVIAANHPLGGLDGLVLLRIVSLVRKDVVIVVTDYLSEIENISGLLLPLRVDNKGYSRDAVQQIHDALQQEKAVIIFPSGEVSRLHFLKVADREWQKGIIYFARKNQAPVLPVYIAAANSFAFYLVSIISRLLSMLLLPGEVFNKKGKIFSVTIGNVLPARNFDKGITSDRLLAKLLRKHVYRLGRHGKPIFSTIETIAHPVDRTSVRDELLHCKVLVRIDEHKSVYLVKATDAPETMREIGRLRELTFRKVGEGTGAKTDIDVYDYHYNHFVLWDDESGDIMGAYRLGVGREIQQLHGMAGLYTSTLFQFRDSFETLLPNAAELGRSFIQPKYWKSSALDYLWMGIGAFLQANPHIQFLFGPVSISNSYHEDAKALMVHFFRKWYAQAVPVATGKNRFTVTPARAGELDSLLTGASMKEDFQILKSYLKMYGSTLPVLFKQYSELCEPGGVHFADFSSDPDFNNCIDGFIVLNLAFLKANKRRRYMPLSVLPDLAEIHTV